MNAYTDTNTAEAWEAFKARAAIAHAMFEARDITLAQYERRLADMGFRGDEIGGEILMRVARTAR